MAQNKLFTRINWETRSLLAFQEDCHPINDMVKELIERGEGVSCFAQYVEKLMQSIKCNFYAKRKRCIQDGLVSGGISVIFMLMSRGLDLDLTAFCFCICFALLFLAIFIGEIINFITWLVTTRALTKAAAFNHLCVRRYRITEKMVYIDTFCDTSDLEYFLCADGLNIKISKGLFEKALKGGTLTAAELLLIDEMDTRYKRFFCVIEVTPPPNEQS